ncbi:hypothetical protein F0562_026863 [Nyssa sinensis]|uniref:Pseudouridine synthase I TruA alpha/beta domain-containing protein n=1 Tax=Nyssa sinensis TaxID=561372 RepID=A0A5J5B4A8_9ASTE|nr:hypothetical protein F0562_026863 [Nyssa sinensis]
MSNNGEVDHSDQSLLTSTLSMDDPPSSPREPNPKKLKMSTTTTSDDEDCDTTTTTTTGPTPEKKPRYKRRKIAIFFAYCGVGYQGMQKNPGAKTIEGDLEEALFLSGAVPEHDRGHSKRYDWARSARTDKGVSAVGQVVSGRFYIDPPGLIDRLHSNLSPQIRIFGYKRVTGSFNAKKFCDRRRSNSESGKEIDNDAVHNESNVLQEPVVEEKRIEGELDECRNREVKPVKGSGFCYGEKERERFNRILKQYVGTHNFHNFTTRIKAEDPSARRFIVSFDANITVTVEGIEFVKCEVVGQSFMLHQIRKLIGLAVAIMRNCAPETLIETALRQDVNINVPTAPEVGLYLDECFFTSYNQKWKDSHEELSMKAYAEEAEDFKMKHIYSHIASSEHKEGAVALWLHSLNHRNYPDLGVVSNGGTTDEKRAKLEDMAE